MPLFAAKKKPSTEVIGEKYLAGTFRESGLLGLVLGDHEKGTLIANWQDHSPACKAELPIGALIVGVNGEEVLGMPPEAVEVLIETGLRPLTLVMEIPPPIKYKELIARFGREGGLGIALHDRAGGGCGVTRVVRGSMAESQGVREGSLLLAINDEDVSKAEKGIVMTLVETAARPLTMRFEVPIGAPPSSSTSSSSPPLLAGNRASSSGRNSSHDDDDALQKALSLSRREALAAQAALAQAADDPPPPVQRRSSDEDLKRALSMSRREAEKALAATTTNASSQAGAAPPKHAIGAKLLVDRSDGSQSECTVISYDNAARCYKVSMDGTDVLKNCTEKMLALRPPASSAHDQAERPQLQRRSSDDELKRALSISRREMEAMLQQQTTSTTTTTSATSASRRSHGDEDAQLARALEASRLQAALEAPARNPAAMELAMALKNLNNPGGSAHPTAQPPPPPYEAARAVPAVVPPATAPKQPQPQSQPVSRMAAARAGAPPPPPPAMLHAARQSGAPTIDRTRHSPPQQQQPPQSGGSRGSTLDSVSVRLVGDGPLGLHLTSNGSGDTVVHSVDPGSLAASEPIPEGSVMLEVNGESLKGLDHQTVGVIIASASRPLSLKISLPDVVRID